MVSALSLGPYKTDLVIITPKIHTLVNVLTRCLFQEIHQKLMQIKGHLQKLKIT